MVDNPFFPLSFIAGPAILTNACAIMQNGATLRYNLAIAQWREFHASLVAGDDRLSSQYEDPLAAVALAERRIRLQLGGLSLLNAAVALFAATTVLGLAGAFLVQVEYFPADAVSLVMVAVGGAGLLFILASTLTFFLEGACGSALLGLHLQFGASANGEPPHRSTGYDSV
jgi:hypothetical protein